MKIKLYKRFSKYLTSLIVIAGATVNSIHAQASFDSKSYSFAKSATVNVSAITEDWYPALNGAEASESDMIADQEELQRIKEQISERFPSGRGQHPYQSRDQATGLYVLKNFQGNIIGNNVPNDNSLAISNGNMLLSAINLNLYMYNMNTGTQVKTVSLATFGASLGLPSNLSDPKVLYDPIADRFILVYFGGFDPVSSKMAICFSQTNDPTGAWNLYPLPGNPLNDTTYSDYPAIAITQGELFLTINEVIPSLPWQTGFKQTRIWQMSTQDGYAGNATITTKLWSNINFAGKPVRYMCPAGGGSQPYGPNMYFLSNNNFGIQTDSLLLLEITGLQSNTSTTLNITYFNTNVRYSTPPDARQAANQKFATNDARILGAFLENGKIQFVHNTLDTVTGFAALYHGIVDNITSSPSATGTIIGDNIMDFGYPNLSYAGNSASDNRAIISYNYTAPTVYSGCAAIMYDGAGNYSVNTNIKKGLNYVDQLTSATERWGDYSGSQRKYNEPGKVWAAASFGTGSFTTGTWIAELSLNDPNLVSGPAAMLHGFAFPNPVKDLVNISFNNSLQQKLSFEIYNAEGKMLKLLYQDVIKDGENIFTFSTAPLSTGIYFLRISSEKEIVFSQKIVKY